MLFLIGSPSQTTLQTGKQAFVTLSDMMTTYKEGKKHLGWSSPAKPALMTPEPYYRNAEVEREKKYWPSQNKQFRYASCDGRYHDYKEQFLRLTLSMTTG